MKTARKTSPFFGNFYIHNFRIKTYRISLSIFLFDCSISKYVNMGMDFYYKITKNFNIVLSGGTNNKFFLNCYLGLPHNQLWAIIEGVASLTQCESLRFYHFDLRVTKKNVIGLGP